MKWKDVPYYLLLCIAAGFLLPMWYHNALVLLFVLFVLPNGDYTALKQWRNPVWFLPGVFFALILSSMLWSEDRHGAWLYAERKLALLVLPFALLLFHFETRTQLLWVFKAYLIGIIAGALYCLVIGLYGFWRTGETDILFYHSFANPVHMSAIYFAVYCLFAIVMAFFYKSALFRHDWQFWTVTAFLSLVLILLASKMVLGLWLSFLVFVMVKQLVKHSMISGLLASGGILILCIGIYFVPFIHQRISTELRTNQSVLRSDHYQYNSQFTGFSLRWTLFKHAIAVLKEEHAWFRGVGAGDFTRLLNKKYVSSGMYTGSGKPGDRGYLDYNPHNQYVEILLTTGITGLTIFLAWMAVLITAAVEEKNKVLLVMVLIFLCLCVTECFLNTNKGVVWFAFFYGLLLKNESLLRNKNK